MKFLVAGCFGLAMASAVAAEVASDTPPQYSFIDYFQHRLATEKPLLAFPDDPAKVPEWREQVVARLRTMLGLELSVPAPLNPRVLDIRKRDGYRVEHVVFTSEANVDVPAYVLIPDGVNAQHPAPAVLCLQGMVPGGKNELTGETDNDPEAAAALKQFHDDFARQLVRAGFVTLSIDMRFDGERTYRAAQDPFGLNSRSVANQVAIEYATWLGQSFYGLNLFDSQRALDYLLTRQEIISGAVGCAGFSFGSQLAAWLGGIDRRVKVIALEGNWESFRRLAIRSFKDNNDRKDGKPQHQMLKSYFNFLPGFLRYFDLNLTMAAAAPTPMVISFETGRWQFHNKAEIDADLAPFYGAYAGFGKPENLHLTQVAGDHYWRAEVILPWFTAKLRELADAHRAVTLK